MTRSLIGISRRETLRLHACLLDAYGPQGWWPAKSRFEIALGAVLVQRTQWRNAWLALDNLARAGIEGVEALLQHAREDLEALVRPAGFYRQKAERIRALCAWIATEGGFSAIESADTTALRSSLLAIKGIGPETADCILLYAFDRPVFVSDAYARRLFHRLGWSPPLGAGDYETLRRRVESLIDEDAAFYNEFHALIVRHGKAACSSTPLCEGCPVRSGCRTGGGISPVRRWSGR